MWQVEQSSALWSAWSKGRERLTGSATERVTTRSIPNWPTGTPLWQAAHPSGVGDGLEWWQLRQSVIPEISNDP